MPYIRKERRQVLSPYITELAGRLVDDGEVNYAITLLLDYRYNLLSYESLNRVIGILECVKQEFYRRRVAPYEDKKKEERGDIF